MMAATTMPAPTGTRGRNADAIDSAVLMRRVRAEFLEMPGLSLTVAQASRLWGITALESEIVLAALVDAGFLMRDRRAAYRRRGCPRCS